MNTQRAFYPQWYTPSALLPVLMSIGVVLTQQSLLHPFPLVFGFLLTLTVCASLVQKPPALPDAYTPVLIWMTTTITWLICGIGVALLFALIATPLTIWLQFLRDKPKVGLPRLYHTLYAMSALCAGILTSHTLHGLFGGQLPLSDPMPYANLVVSFVAVTGGFVVMQVVRLIFFQRVQRDLPQLLHQYQDFVWIIPLQLILPLIFFAMGHVVFFLAMIVACGQILHQSQLRQAENELEKHIGEIQTLKNISDIIDNHGTVQDILETAHTKAGQLLTFSVFFAAIYDPKQQHITYPVVYEHGVKLQLPTHGVAESFVQTIIDKQQPLRITRQDAPHALIFEHYPQANAFLGVPLVAQQMPLGVIGVLQFGSLTYDQTDLDLLATLANQLGLALYFARLNDDSRRISTNFSLVNQSLQTIMFNVNSDNALQTTCEVAQEIVSAQKVAIFLYDLRDSGEWEVVHQRGFLYGETALLDLVVPFLDPDNPMLLKVDQITTTHIPAMMHFQEATHVQSFVHIPLQSGKIVMGYLGVYHDVPYNYSVTDVETLQLLGGQLAGALDNAEGLRILEGFAAEQTQLMHLSRISGLDLNLERVIVEVCRQIAHMMDFPEVFIALYDDERDSVLLHTHDPKQRDHLSSISVQNIPELNDLLNAEQPRSLVTYDWDEDRYSDELRDFLHEHEYQTLIVTILPRDGSTLGLLLLGDQQSRKLNDSQRRLLEVAKHQIAANIQNAQIHTYTEKALIEGLEQLALIEDMAQRVSSALSLETIVDNLLDAALMASHANLVVLKLAVSEADLPPVLWQSVVGETVQRGRATQSQYVSLEEETLDKRTTRRISNNPNQLAHLQDFGEGGTYHSALIVPMHTASQGLGVLTLASHDTDAFSYEQASFIKGLVGNASVSIEHILLLNQREQQIATLTQLRRLSLESVTANDLESVQQHILRAAMHILDGVVGGYYEVIRNGLETLTVQFRRLEGKLVTVDDLHFPADVVEAVSTTNKIQVIRSEQGLTAAGYRDLLVVPIRYGEFTRAILCIGSDKMRSYQGDDLSAVALLAVQAANHLETAMLNEALRTQNKRMRVILDSTRDGIVFLDRDGQVQDANTAASNLLKADWRHNDPVDLALNTAQFAEPLSWQSLLEAAEDDPTLLHQREFHLEDQQHYLKTLITTVQDVDETTLGHLLILRDVTDEKALNQFRSKMQDMMLHDLRSPLTAIISSLYLSQEYAKQGEIPRKPLSDILGISVNSATNLLKLLDSLRDLPEMRKMLINPESSSFDYLVRNAYIMLSAMLEAEQIHFSYDLQAADEVFVDRSLVHRILINLLNNAFNYTPSGGEIRVATEPAPDDNFICVLVADTGPGIPEEMRHKVFEQFAQGDEQPTRDDNKGMGLGLYFCKMAVEAHGGKIEVRLDGPLSGACIAFTLPLQIL